MWPGTALFGVDEVPWTSGAWQTIEAHDLAGGLQVPPTVGVALLSTELEARLDAELMAELGELKVSLLSAKSDRLGTGVGVVAALV